MFCKEKTYPFTKEGYRLMIQDMENRNVLIDFERIVFSKPKMQRVFFCTTLVLALIMVSNPFDSIGFKFLGYTRAAGYWICLIKAIMVVVKGALEGDIFAIGKRLLVIC